MSRYRWHIDRFDTTLHLSKRQRTYEAVKAAVLAAGRFSCFEASEYPADFNQLCRDPELTTFDFGYPWTGVKLRIGAQEEPEK